MPFKFTLEPLLNLERQKEDQVKTKLHNALIEYNRAVKQKEQLARERDDLQECMRTAAKRDGSSLGQYFTYALILNTRIKRQEENVAELDQVVQAIKNELLTKRQEVKKLERLREKQLVKYLYIEQRMEQQAIDEVAAVQFIRGGGTA